MYICLGEYMTTQETTLDLETIFRALSDRTRLRILNMLRLGELCVCDLVAVLEVPQPTASRHLAYLRKANLVAARKEGLWHYYRLTSAQTMFHQRLRQCIEAAAGVDGQLTADLEKLKFGGRPSCCD